MSLLSQLITSSILLFFCLNTYAFGKFNFIDLKPKDKNIVCNVQGELKEVSSKRKCDKAKFSKFRKFIDDQKISASLKLIDLELADALTIGLKYKYKVKPNKGDEYFTRIDRYKLEGQLTPGDLLDDMPLYIGMSAGNEIIFTQQFESGRKARSPKSTYTPKKLPTTSKKALELKTGDYVKFSAHMNLSVGVGQTWFLAGDLIKSSSKFGYLIGGQYQVHIYRLNDSRVRLKLIGLRKKGTSFSAKFGADKKLEILGISFLDKQLVKLSDIDDWFNFKLARSNDDIFALDYVVDLSSDSASKAYDEIFNSIKKLNSFKVANPLKGKVDIKNMLISNIEDLETLAQEQMLIKESEQKTVIRKFKGSNSPESRTRKFSYGLLTFKAERKESYRKNFLTSVKNDGSEVREYFVYPSWTRKSEREQGLLAQLFHIAEGEDESVFQSSSAIFKSDRSANPNKFINISFSYSYEDREASSKELKLILNRISQILPTEGHRHIIEEKLNKAGWLSKKSADHANIRMDYLFHNKALYALESPSFGRGNYHGPLSQRKVMEYEFYRYADVLGVFESEYRKSRSTSVDPRHFDEKGKYSALKKIAGAEGRELIHNLRVTFNKKRSNQGRLESFSRLRKNELFKSHGVGFLLYLLSKVSDSDSLSEFVYLKLQFKASNKELVAVTFGDKGERDYYDAIRFIEFVLNNDSDNVREWEDVQEMLSKSTIVTESI